MLPRFLEPRIGHFLECLYPGGYIISAEVCEPSGGGKLRHIEPNPSGDVIETLQRGE